MTPAIGLSILKAMRNFTLSRTPELTWGEGSFDRLCEHIETRGYDCIVLFTGGASFSASVFRTRLDKYLASVERVRQFEVALEPSADFIDAVTDEVRSESPELVISIGGGSVIDAGKAVSAMIFAEGSVTDYLEGVGDKKHDGRKVPFVAVPTTAGTGSEATKNAVITGTASKVFKKSLRHPNFVPDMAFVDPLLTVSCSRSITARSGLDAATQLLESFVSVESQPVTDSLARLGLSLVGRSFAEAVRNGDNLSARTDMSFAAYISGVTLANAGLGIVHGLASVIGGIAGSAHGAICGSLVSRASEIVIEKLESIPEHKNESAVSQALRKYAEAGVLLSGKDAGTAEGNRSQLIETLNDWIEEFEIETLDELGVNMAHISSIAASAGIKNTPVELDADDILSILQDRIRGKQ